jgi:IS5 family transposase
MKRTGFASAAFAGEKRKTRRERFPAEMDLVVPRARSEAPIEPHCP